MSIRESIHLRAYRAHGTFTDWLCEKPPWISGHDWPYGLFERPIMCVLRGNHRADGDHCVFCGHPMSATVLDSPRTRTHFRVWNRYGAFENALAMRGPKWLSHRDFMYDWMSHRAVCMIGRGSHYFAGDVAETIDLCYFCGAPE